MQAANQKREDVAEVGGRIKGVIKMKRLILFAALIAITITAYPQDRTTWLNNRRAELAAELSGVQDAKTAREADSAKIAIITGGLPLLDQLIVDCQDASLRAIFLEWRDKYAADIESWTNDMANWDAEIVRLTAMIAEIDRLLAL